ncbi:MAG: ATP-binding protein [Thermoplasmata archaeon]|nr:ATP-binding protein [Thermoplasmata archaeon]
MLLDFSVKNFGPFRDRATLSMMATSYSEHPENVIESDAAKGKVLTSAAVFGPNASGKSALFEAVESLKGIAAGISTSGRTSGKYRPFGSNSESPVEMQIRFVDGGILYVYSVSYTADDIVSESLYHSPKGRRALVFKRVMERGSIRFERADLKLAFRTESCNAYLAVAAAFGDPVCKRVRSFIDGITVIGTRNSPATPELSVSESCRYIAEHSVPKEQVLAVLNAADLNVVDIVIEERGGPSPDSSDQKRYGARLVHGYGGSGTDGGGPSLPMDEESQGTVRLFSVSGPLVDALSNGKVLFIDGFGSYLHPFVTRWILENLSTRFNVNGAQVIVNTHDVTLLDIEGLFRRDQVYFVNRSCTDGASEMYCLSDFKGVRKDTNVRVEYDMGRYEALPLQAAHLSVRRGCRATPRGNTGGSPATVNMHLRMGTSWKSTWASRWCSA